MAIDVDRLTEFELIDRNHSIVERRRFFAADARHAAMLDLKIGDRVTFQPPGEREVSGMLKHYNKTVTIITDEGRPWNVSPHFIRKQMSSTDRVRPGQQCRASGQAASSRGGPR